MKIEYGVPKERIFKGSGKNIYLKSWTLNDDNVNIELLYEGGSGFKQVCKKYTSVFFVLDDLFKMGIFNHTNRDIGLTMYEYSFLYNKGKFQCTSESAHDGILMYHATKHMFERLFDKSCININIKVTSDCGDELRYSRVQDINFNVNKKRRIK